MEQFRPSVRRNVRLDDQLVNGDAPAGGSRCRLLCSLTLYVGVNLLSLAGTKNGCDCMTPCRERRPRRSTLSLASLLTLYVNVTLLSAGTPPLAVHVAACCARLLCTLTLICFRSLLLNSGRGGVRLNDITCRGRRPRRPLPCAYTNVTPCNYT